MKFRLTACLLLLAAINGFAQPAKPAVTDDLVKDKEVVLANYIPMSNGQFLYSMYVIGPKVFTAKIDSFRASFAAQIKREPNAATRELKKKDVDNFARNVLSLYTSLYGMDSVGMENFSRIIIEKKGDPDFGRIIDSANKKIFIKKLTPEERTTLTEYFGKAADMNNSALFKRSAAYRKWVDDNITKIRQSKYRQDTALGYEGNDIVKLKVVNNEISDSFIKEYLNYKLVGNIIKMVKDVPAKEAAYQNFMAVVTNPVYKTEIQEIYSNYKNMSPGSPSPGFTFTSADNQQVSLKDLRGKYVYIDVWATWCTPCKGEIPFLTKVEEDYHGRNIHFVSLSVDNMKDKQTWLKYVSDHKLQGIQLMSDKDFSADFVQKFNINSIPRFILIDPDGKIVDANAKRPSDAALRQQLDQLLN